MDYSKIDPARRDSEIRRLVTNNEDPDLGLGKASITRCCGMYACNRFRFTVEWKNGSRDSFSALSMKELMRDFHACYTVIPSDPWGRRIVTEFDGHDSFGCNNHDCLEHPPSLYGKVNTRTGEVLV